MDRLSAREFVQDYAQTSAAPALTLEEVERCLDRSRTVDSEGRRIGDPGYVESIWATRAVVLAIDIHVAKAAAKTDLTADGASILASQRTTHWTALRKSWRARQLPGSA